MSWPNPLRPRLALVTFVGAAFLSGAVGSWATFAGVRTWYPTLAKPSWNPPNGVFGPVWTALYVLMGVAAWRAWRAAPAARGLVRGYFAQLAANALWSVLFFGLRQPAWALADVLVLWGLLAWLQVSCWRVDRVAGVLWAPYLLWVSFATVLNAAIVRLN